MQAQPHTKRRIRWRYLVIALVAFALFIGLSSVYTLRSASPGSQGVSLTVQLGAIVSFLSGLVSVLRFIWDVVRAIRNRRKSTVPANT